MPANVCLHPFNPEQAQAWLQTHAPAFAHQETHNVFASALWLERFVEHISTPSWTIQVACYGEARDTAEAVMLLRCDAAAPRQWSAVENYYTSLSSPLISNATEPGQRAQAIHSMLKAWAQSVHAPGTIHWSPIADDDADTQALEAALKSLGWYTQRHVCFGNWYLPCAGLRFESYMAARDSKLYNTWNRKRKKFENPSNASARLELITEAADVDRGIDAYEQVYNKSWKQSEPFPRFIREWARSCAERGWLRLGLAWVDDVPIAAQLWFNLHGHAYIFKLAYDEDYAKLSAGTVLTAHLFRHALDVDQVHEIDYLTGDDPYKKSWMSHRRERIGVLACNPRTWSGCRRIVQEVVGEWTRPLRRIIARSRSNTTVQHPT